MFWGVEVNGFAFGNTVIMDNKNMKSILGVIDSGTTLVILPEIVFINFITELAETVRDDPQIDLVCTRKNDSSGILKRLDHCYFNNTDCSTLIDDHGSKLGSIKFHMGDYIFEQNFATALRDGNNTVASTNKKVPCCSLGIRGREKDYMNPKRVLGIICIIIGAAMLFGSNYIAEQVEEGKARVQSAESTMSTTNSILSLNPVTDQVGQSLNKSANKKIAKGKEEIAKYEALASKLQVAGVILIVIGIGILILGRKK